jgi:addiction module HigA family antidote
LPKLKELRISAELARQIDVPVNRVTGIINGQRAITADTALRLGHWYGASAEFWLNLQKQVKAADWATPADAGYP